MSSWHPVARAQGHHLDDGRKNLIVVDVMFLFETLGNEPSFVFGFAQTRYIFVPVTHLQGSGFLLAGNSTTSHVSFYCIEFTSDRMACCHHSTQWWLFHMSSVLLHPYSWRSLGPIVRTLSAFRLIWISSVPNFWVWILRHERLAGQHFVNYCPMEIYLGICFDNVLA